MQLIHACEGGVLFTEGLRYSALTPTHVWYYRAGFVWVVSGIISQNTGENVATHHITHLVRQLPMSAGWPTYTSA
jgi:hypothetical protein